MRCQMRTENRQPRVLLLLQSGTRIPEHALGGHRLVGGVVRRGHRHARRHGYRLGRAIGPRSRCGWRLVRGSGGCCRNMVRRRLTRPIIIIIIGRGRRFCQVRAYLLSNYTYFSIRTAIYNIIHYTTPNSMANLSDFVQSSFLSFFFFNLLFSKLTNN